LLNSFDVTGSALTAGRLRLDVIANNIANVETTRTSEGGPYQRRSVVLQNGGDDFSSIFRREIDRLPLSANPTTNNSSRGVQANRITRDSSPPEMRYDPDHPDANEDGYVAYPNVDLVREMTDLLMANRAYSANSSAFDVTKNMVHSTNNLGR